MGADRQGKAKTQPGLRQILGLCRADPRDGHRHNMGTQGRPGKGG
jgi:hypothetical protein